MHRRIPGTNLVTCWVVALPVDAADRLPNNLFLPANLGNNPRPRRYLFCPHAQNSKNSESSLQNSSYPSIFPQTIVQNQQNKASPSPSYSTPYITFLHLLTFMQILQAFMQILQSSMQILTKSFMEILLSFMQILQSVMQILTLINYFKINFIIFLFLT